jgi:uncharacterized membrane protein
MRYVIPTVVDRMGTVIAINVGGALIPSLTSFYLLAKHRLWGTGVVAIGCVAAVCHWLAEPIPVASALRCRCSLRPRRGRSKQGSAF